MSEDPEAAGIQLVFLPAWRYGLVPILKPFILRSVRVPKLCRLPVLTVLLFVASGCGTMANLDGRKLAMMDLPQQEDPKPFGGVGRDVRWIASGLVFFVADIPFSL